MYIANLGSSSLSILDAVAGYPVRFEETGLAPGTSWSVTSQGVTRSSTSSTVTFYQPNGSDVYTLYPVTGYTLETNATGISDVTEAGGVRIPLEVGRAGFGRDSAAGSQRFGSVRAECKVACLPCDFGPLSAAVSVRGWKREKMPNSRSGLSERLRVDAYLSAIAHA
jgi:hypothetical protein